MEEIAFMNRQIGYSTEDRAGYYDFKQNEPSMMNNALRKQAALQQLQNSSQMNGENMSKVECETNKTLGTKGGNT